MSRDLCLDLKRLPPRQKTKKAISKERKERTASKAAHLAATSTDVRSRVRQQIQRALTARDTSSSVRPRIVATALEKSIFALFKVTNTSYKSRAREIIFNISDRQNTWLYRDLLAGTLTPGRLCEMTPQDMASDALKNERAARLKKNRQDATVQEPDRIETDELTCPKCGGKKAGVRELRSRNQNDMKSEIWGSGSTDQAESVEEIKCLLCGHTWLKNHFS